MFVVFGNTSLSLILALISDDLAELDAPQIIHSASNGGKINNPWQQCQSVHRWKNVGVCVCVPVTLGVVSKSELIYIC